MNGAFLDAHYGGACAHDYQCAADYYCETQVEAPYCQRYEAEAVCTVADAEELMSRHEDDQTVPEVSYGCIACMAGALTAVGLTRIVGS